MAAKNQHRNLTGDALHNPKGFDGASNGTKPFKDGAGALDWITETQLPKALDYVSAQSTPPTEVTGDVYLIDTTGTAYDINTIAWQSGNTIRIAFNGSPDLSAVAIDDYFITSGNANSSNDGTFIITTVNDGSDYIEITNNDRSDATDDEATDAVGTGYYTLAEWDAVSKASHVTFDGSIWSSITPSEGQSCYDVTLGSIRLFDGTDWSSSLGGGGGLTDIVDDTTPQLGGTLDANGNIIDMGTNTITDTKVGQWDTAYGWGDHSGQGYVTSTSEANNRIAVFTGTDAIEGDANLTWNSAALTVTDGTDTTEVRDKFISVKSESDDANLYLYGYGAGSNSGEIYLAGSRGTIASPTATQSGDTLGEIGIFGAVPGLRQGARILFQATENYVDTSNYGTKFVIQTTKNGTATLATRYTIDGDGNHGFVGDIKYSQQVYQDGGIYNGGSTGTSFTPNFINGNLQKVTMSNASITINNPTNAKDGATYTMCFVQDATASRTIATWGSDWNWGDAGAPDFSGGTAAGDKFYVTVIVNGTELDAIYSGVKH
jgi:hypothetical protein